MSVHSRESTQGRKSLAIMPGCPMEPKAVRLDSRGSGVLGWILRLEEQTNQFLMSSLEQQLLEGKRKRDAEAQLMNATIYQWRFGQNYGQDLFRHTAADLDAWRPY